MGWKRQGVLILFPSGEAKMFQQNVSRFHRGAGGRRTALGAVTPQRGCCLDLMHPGLGALV